MQSRPYRDRADAGRRLADRLTEYAGRTDVLVLALPRGGVPVAFEVAQALHAPLDVFLVRKLGAPGHEELAMGAIASGGMRLLNKDVVRALRVSPDVIDRVAATELKELERRERQYRGGRPLPDVCGKTVILVDDGLATGASMRAAVVALRLRRPARLVVAVPIAAPSTCEEFRREVDEVVCVLTPEPFQAVGIWYDDFSQTSDDEVCELLRRAGGGHAPDPDGSRPDAVESETRKAETYEHMVKSVDLTIGDVTLQGDLAVPEGAWGIVVFAHGSGSGRRSVRNRFVAETLHERGLATLLFDLLTEREEREERFTRHLRFDIGLLAGRLIGAVDWLSRRPETSGLTIGLFGASTGGGAALAAAAVRPESVAAVVSRGGRPDLAGKAALARVQAPTLLIVGGRDEPVIALNRDAAAAMSAPVSVVIVPDATHLFEEPGALEEVARLACHWFERHLTRGEE